MEITPAAGIAHHVPTNQEIGRKAQPDNGMQLLVEPLPQLAIDLRIAIPQPFFCQLPQHAHIFVGLPAETALVLVFTKFRCETAAFQQIHRAGKQGRIIGIDLQDLFRRAEQLVGPATMRLGKAAEQAVGIDAAQEAVRIEIDLVAESCGAKCDHLLRTSQAQQRKPFHVGWLHADILLFAQRSGKIAFQHFAKRINHCTMFESRRTGRKRTLLHEMRAQPAVHLLIACCIERQGHIQLPRTVAEIHAAGHPDATGSCKPEKIRNPRHRIDICQHQQRRYARQSILKRILPPRSPGARQKLLERMAPLLLFFAFLRVIQIQQLLRRQYSVAQAKPAVTVQ